MKRRIIDYLFPLILLVIFSFLLYHSLVGYIALLILLIATIWVICISNTFTDRRIVDYQSVSGFDNLENYLNEFVMYHPSPHRLILRSYRKRAPYFPFLVICTICYSVAVIFFTIQPLLFYICSIILFILWRVYATSIPNAKIADVVKIILYAIRVGVITIVVIQKDAAVDILRAYKYLPEVLTSTLALDPIIAIMHKWITE